MMNTGEKVQEERIPGHNKKQINMWIEIHTLQFQGN